MHHYLMRRLRRPSRGQGERSQRSGWNFTRLMIPLDNPFTCCITLALYVREIRTRCAADGQYMSRSGQRLAGHIPRSGLTLPPTLFPCRSGKRPLNSIYKHYKINYPTYGRSTWKTCTTWMVEMGRLWRKLTLSYTTMEKIIANQHTIVNWSWNSSAVWFIEKASLLGDVRHEEVCKYMLWYTCLDRPWCTRCWRLV